jgi:hypothetical protein
MRGAVFLGNRQIEIRNFPDPAPGPGEVVIRMRAQEAYRVFDAQSSGKGVIEF